MANKKGAGRPKKWTELEAMKLAEELDNWLKKNEMNFYFERFLFEEKSLYPQLISELSEQYPKFSEAIQRFKKIKEIRIMDLGLKMGLSAALVKFYMINNSNWAEKIETDNKTELSGAIEFNLSLPGITDTTDESETEEQTED